MWVMPRDWVTGELVTSTIMNAAIRDELKVMSAIGSKPAFNAYNSVNGNPNSGVATAHTFDSEHYDYDSMHEGVVHPSRGTVNTPGRLFFGGCIEFAANATGERAISLLVTFAGGGTKTIAAQKVGAAPVATTQLTIGSRPYPFSVGDYVELIVFQSSGATLNTDAVGDFGIEFWAEQLAFA